MRAGTARCVWVDYALGKSVPLPQVLRDAIESALGAKVD